MKYTPLLLCYTMCLVQGDGDWIDPHAMDFKYKDKVKSILSNVQVQNSETYCTSLNSEGPCESDIHLKRIIRLILNNSNIKKTSGVNYHNGLITIQLTSEDYDVLQGFASNEGNIGYNEISSILEVALQKSAYDRYSESVNSLQEQIYLMIFNSTSAALACCIFLLVICYKLLRANFSWWAIAKYFIFLAYVLDCVITYLYLVETEEIENMVLIKTHGTLPPECDPKRMSWLQYMKFQYSFLTISENECKSYYRATFQNLKYLVTPLKVFNHQLGTFIVQPLKHFGEGMGSFATAMSSSLPWGIGIFLFPMMLVTTCIIICILLIFVTKTRVKINVFHLIHFELGDSHRQRMEPSSSNQNPLPAGTVQHLVYVTQHRSLVENVQNENNTPPIVSIKDKESESNEAPSKTKEHKKVNSSCADASQCESTMNSDSEDTEEYIETVMSETNSSGKE